MNLYRVVLAKRRPDGSRYEDHYILRDEERLASFGRNYYPVEFAEPVDRCGYDIGAGWHPERCGEPEPCPVHAARRCVVCGGSAKEACSNAGGQFVCGAPLCGRHPHPHC